MKQCILCFHIYKVQNQAKPAYGVKVRTAVTFKKIKVKESGHGEISSVLVKIYFLIWVVVTQCAHCKNASSYSLVLCALFSLYVLIQQNFIKNTSKYSPSFLISAVLKDFVCVPKSLTITESRLG